MVCSATSGLSTTTRYPCGRDVSSITSSTKPVCLSPSRLLWSFSDAGCAPFPNTVSDLPRLSALCSRTKVVRMESAKKRADMNSDISDDILFGRAPGTVSKEPEPDPERSSWVHALRRGEWKSAPVRFVPKLGSWHRRFLARIAECVEVGDSLIVGAGRGVFATRDIEVGFRMPYIGVVYWDDRDMKGDGAYNMWCGDSRGGRITGAVDGHPARATRTHNFAPFINEPPRSTARIRANMDMRVFCDADWNDLTPCILHATRFIRKGEELYMDYGDEYLSREDHYGPASGEVVATDFQMLD